jgi:hypothetical protein
VLVRWMFLVVLPAVRTVENTMDESQRLKREARALAIIKAMRPGQTVYPEPIHTELKGDHPNPTGVVYFAYCADRIKIGFTTDTAIRFVSMGTNSPYLVTLLLTITGTQKTEAGYHKLFAKDRIHREWFRLSEDFTWFFCEKLCDSGMERYLNAIVEFHDPLNQPEDFGFVPEDPGVVTSHLSH